MSFDVVKELYQVKNCVKEVYSQFVLIKPDLHIWGIGVSDQKKRVNSYMEMAYEHENELIILTKHGLSRHLDAVYAENLEQDNPISREVYKDMCQDIVVNYFLELFPDLSYGDDNEKIPQAISIADELISRVKKL